MVLRMAGRVGGSGAFFLVSLPVHIGDDGSSELLFFTWKEYFNGDNGCSRFGEAAALRDRSPGPEAAGACALGATGLTAGTSFQECAFLQGAG